MATGEGTGTDRIRQVIFGEEDPRVRATWRVLLAVPLLWILTGGVLADNLQSAIDVIPSGQARGGGFAQSVLHGGFFLLALFAWARYLDRQPPSNYWVSLSPAWVRDFLVGFAAVVVGAIAWAGLSSGLGGTSVMLLPTTPERTVLFGLVPPRSWRWSSTRRSSRSSSSA